MVLQNSATMAYSLRRTGEPRVFSAEQSVVTTACPNNIFHIVIGVEPVCELLSIYGKHFTEFELDVDWIFSSALQKAIDPVGYELESAVESLDCEHAAEFDEYQTLHALVDMASACITKDLPATLKPQQLYGMRYAGFRNGRIALALHQDLENE